MKVALVMGSKSDHPIAEKAIAMLNKFGVESLVRVISAHRALDMLVEFVGELDSLGVGTVIAIAGKAAHLPGVIAGMTTLPVIGVPVKGSAFLGMDALLSIVQMPTGVPVATVAVDAGDNAAILACQILALSSQELAAKLRAYKKELAEDVRAQDRSLHS
ncbi:MAG TPA: 5-(carboxyamino)imidazole ribonucleotide mutase [Bellilinea sp.]|nr:5-(carboxyamino)imidazole ribonucleotide mutase [Bellilinea sp.]